MRASAHQPLISAQKSPDQVTSALHAWLAVRRPHAADKVPLTELEAGSLFAWPAGAPGTADWMFKHLAGFTSKGDGVREVLVVRTMQVTEEYQLKAPYRCISVASNDTLPGSPALAGRPTTGQRVMVQFNVEGSRVQLQLSRRTSLKFTSTSMAKRFGSTTRTTSGSERRRCPLDCVMPYCGGFGSHTFGSFPRSYNSTTTGTNMMYAGSILYKTSIL